LYPNLTISSTSLSGGTSVYKNDCDAVYLNYNIDHNEDQNITNINIHVNGFQMKIRSLENTGCSRVLRLAPYSRIASISSLSLSSRPPPQLHISPQKYAPETVEHVDLR